jgi:N-acetylmuramoyl-L-alanine amidase
MRKIPSVSAVILICLLFFFSTGVSLQKDNRIEIHNLRHHTHPTFTRIVLDIGDVREYIHNKLVKPDRIYVDVFQAKLNPILHGTAIPIENDYLKRIRIAQKNPTTVRMAVDLDFARTDHYRVFHLPDPFRIVIDIYPAEENSVNPPEPTETGYSIARQLGLGIQRIVLDPGHGGKDPGCIGRKGLLEKEVVLDVSERLRELLASRLDLDVVMTRESDIFIPVENRPVVANQKKADLFISIHANSNPSKNHTGIETFFLNFSLDPSVNAIAARENATSTKNLGEMKDIITKIAQNSKIAESKELAEKVQTELVSHLSRSFSDIRSLGVKGGPFWVLIGGDMPSVLVEISHLSNLKEENRLSTAKYRQNIAEGIYQGIQKYIQSLGKG